MYYRVGILLEGGYQLNIYVTTLFLRFICQSTAKKIASEAWVILYISSNVKVSSRYKQKKLPKTYQLFWKVHFQSSSFPNFVNVLTGEKHTALNVHQAER